MTESSCHKTYIAKQLNVMNEKKVDVNNNMWAAL